MAARSPVFKEMLNSQMLESTTGLVVIEDIDLSTMQEVLHYVYTDAATEQVEFDGRISVLLLWCHCAKNISFKHLRLGDMHNRKMLKGAALP